MSENSIVAVIDIGKTNVKLALVDMVSLSEIAVITQPNKVLAGPPYPHFDVDSIWNFIVKSLHEFSKTYKIDAITTTTHGACCALLDEQGNLATPILDYEFDGLATTAEAYNKVRPDFSETGSPRLSGGLNIGAQLYWLFETFPELESKTKSIVTYPQYWAARLTGLVFNEYTSLGCHTDLWVPQEGKFSSLVARCGWSNMMAPVAKATDLIGPVKSEIAAKIGLKTGTPIYCGIHDSNASLFPHLLSRRAPFSVVSTGTWVISMAIGGDDIELDPARDTLMNVNGLCQPVPSARFMGGREFEILMEDRSREYTPDDVTNVLQKEVMLMPSIVTSSGPYQGHQFRWLGEDKKLSGGEYYVAVSFYLALMTASCLELIGAKGDCLVEGPFAKNVLFCNMLAAATNRRVIPSEGTGTSIGAALLTVEKRQLQTLLNECSAHFSNAFKSYTQRWSIAVNKAG